MFPHPKRGFSRCGKPMALKLGRSLRLPLMPRPPMILRVVSSTRVAQMASSIKLQHRKVS
jgi:hypothetical protein